MYIFSIFILMFVLLALQVPIAVTVGICALYTICGSGTMDISFLPVASFKALDNFTLLAIPFFILAGQFMARGGIAKHILGLAEALMGPCTGGLAMVTIVACLIFGAFSGSGPASVAAIGSIMIPAMLARGYDPKFSSAVAACAGVLAIIIPPSNPMVVYSVVTNTSVGRMFLAGIIPGVMVAGALMLVAYLVSKKEGWRGTTSRPTLRGFLTALKHASWAMMVPVIILGGIYGGICTPTEAAAAACLYATLVGMFVYHEFTFKELPGIIADCCQTVCPVLFIIAMAVLFGQTITVLNIPQSIAAFLQSLTSNLLLQLLIINVFLLFLGMFMDTMPCILIFAPLFLPVVTALGIDPVQFGVIMIVNLGIGFITPPMGVNLFVASSISGCPGLAVARRAVPFIGAMLVVLALLTCIPQLTLWLPRLYYGF